MATITPVRSSPAANIEKVSWETLTSADTATEAMPAGFLRGAVQVTGTFGGGTCVIQASNDGTNWVTADDVNGNAISFTAAGGAEIDARFLYYRPSTSGGTGDDLDITLILRSTGQH